MSSSKWHAISFSVVMAMPRDYDWWRFLARLAMNGVVWQGADTPPSHQATLNVSLLQVGWRHETHMWKVEQEVGREVRWGRTSQCPTVTIRRRMWPTNRSGGQKLTTHTVRNRIIRVSITSHPHTYYICVIHTNEWIRDSYWVVTVSRVRSTLASNILPSA